MTKTCKICLKDLPLTDFSSQTIKNQLGDLVRYYRPECKPCRAAKLYKKTGSGFGKRLTEDEKKRLAPFAASHKVIPATTLLKEAKLNMTYQAFLRYKRRGEVDKWFEAMGASPPVTPGSASDDESEE